ncbi:MAG TPA: Asd/ArgC dimerization domain-containing protein [Bryobacteraceae bacterium]|nr:Asd/ArgC dimerization domain-containing protein [Bryobacteraceae bacterium]
MHLHRGAPKCTVAVIGGESLLGKEVRELLESSALAVNVKLIASTDAGDTIIAAVRDEPVVINSMEMADLGSAGVVVLAGNPESSRHAYEQIQNVKAKSLLIDVKGGMEDLPGTRLRAPMAEPPGLKASAQIQVIAHPAAIAIALFLTHLRKAGIIRRSVIQIIEPASERGSTGIDELQKQTVALLSFKPLPKEIYDAQAAFNLLPEYGADSPHKLAGVELKIERHLASLLATEGSVPMPSIRVIHAPVFHGYGISVWTEFENNPGMEAILDSLASNDIDIRTADHEPPSNVGVAGQRGITVGAISPDRNEPRAVWFWIVTDNLRIAAENVVEVVRENLK